MNFKEANMKYLMDLSGGEPSIMREMVHLFVTQTPFHLEQLAGFIENRDWENIRSMAHHIKPTLSYMGAENMRMILQEIEKMAEEKRDYDQIVADFIPLRQRFEVLFVELADYLATLK